MLLANTTETTTVPHSSKESIGKAIGRIASGVFIVTLEKDGQRQGVMATWINQASFQPPLVTVCFNKERAILHLLEPEAVLSVSVLSNKNMDVFKAFAKPIKENEDRFDGLEIATSKNGGVYFPNAVSYLDCRVHSMLETGDHILVVAEVIGGAQLQTEEPMVHLRKNGFQY